MAKQRTIPFGDGVALRPGQVSPELVDANVSNHSDTRVFNDEPSLTRQEFADECDINVIMAQYEKTGVVSHMSPREPMYVDLTGVPDFRNAMDMMLDAEKAFMSLPAKVRKEFDNDARNFVDFASNPDNLDKMREWGLAPPAPPPSPKAIAADAAAAEAARVDAGPGKEPEPAKP